MKEIQDLKKGDKIYDINYDHVVWYTYLCVHPKNKSYYILVDNNEDPFRIYEEKLKFILKKDLNSYEQAALRLADKLEERVKFLRDEHNQESK